MASTFAPSSPSSASKVPAWWAALLLLPLALAGCSEGKNDSDDDPTTTAPASSSSDTSSAGSSAPTTTELGTSTSTSTGPGTTGDEPTGSSTAAVSTTGDETTSGTTGPICDPGQGNCVCDNGMCVDGFVCELGVCVPGPLVCPGDLEPGDDAEDTATKVGDITDDDGEKFTVSGVLSGADDADWYTYHGQDTFGYVAEPTLTLIAGAQRMCQFLVCDEGGPALTEVTCPDGSKFALSPSLRPGCCADTSFKIDDLNCKGQNESATIWIRVDKPVVDECSSYEIQLNF